MLMIVTFALNWGPNIGSYVLPTAVFPPEVRSTFHGLSSACGKLGALAGTFIYAPVQNSLGLAYVMYLQVALSVIGVVLSIYFIPDDKKITDKSIETTQQLKINAPLLQSYT